VAEGRKARLGNIGRVLTPRSRNPRFDTDHSAATAHLRNDDYMQEFEKGWKELHDAECVGTYRCCCVHVTRQVVDSGMNIMCDLSWAVLVAGRAFNPAGQAQGGVLWAPHEHRNQPLRRMDSAPSELSLSHQQPPLILPPPPVQRQQLTMLQ
jgi:hypothetical protein